VENRNLLETLRERHGREVEIRKYIHELFPYGFGQQACKIAGLGKPLKPCMACSPELNSEACCAAPAITPLVRSCNALSLAPAPSA